MRHLLTALLAAVLVGVAAAPSSAGTFTLRYCQAEPWPAPAPGVSPMFSASTAGASLSPASPLTVWKDACSLVSTVNTNPGGDPVIWSGSGAGWEGKAAIGSSALLYFTPPAGTTLTRLRASQHIYVGGDSWAAAAVWTSAGRPLNDISGHLSGFGEQSIREINYDAAALGTDGAAGIRWGAICPSPSDPIVTWCARGQTSLDRIELNLQDPTPPAVELTGAVDATGAATVTVQSSDPQSGIYETRIFTVIQTDEFTETCNRAIVPPCPATSTRQSAAQLAPGESRTYTVTVRNFASEDTIKTITLSRPAADPGPPQQPGPQDPPTQPPYTPPSTRPGGSGNGTTPSPKPPASSKPRTTLSVKRTGRRLTIRGKATGCRTVSVTLGGKTTRVKTARSTGRWSLRRSTKTTRKAKVTVRCGKTERSVRR